MTDIEKKAFKITLIRAITAGLFLVSCTWEISGQVNGYRNELRGLHESINVLVTTVHNLSNQVKAEKDKMAEMQIDAAHTKHKLDSITKLMRYVSTKKKSAFHYYKQRKIDGHLITEETSD